MGRLHLLVIGICTFGVAHAATCAWDSCNKWSTEKEVINVHLIPHTHDDLGWIKTVDQYYYGCQEWCEFHNNFLDSAKPALVPVGVQYIYNTVIDELLKNSTRRFAFAETGFLWRWYTSHGDFERHELQKLIKNGQIELIGGGWVQNDEAASHYVDIIDQMTLGLRKLTQAFGECGKPKVAWQIDPFGHSREVANIFAQMGFESLFFARMHYLEKAQRLKDKSLEFIWNASDDLKTNILTGAFFQDNYGPPEGFCWDALCGDDPIMDNPNLEDYNVNEKVNAFIKHVRKQVDVQRTSHVMILLGSDFQYTNANTWYTNIDKLIRYVNERTEEKVNVFYSTPSCYVQGILDASPSLTTKHDDFFPYASGNHSYWTGYFTSRPALKGMIRQASSLLQLVKRLEVMGQLGPEYKSDIEVMKEASALLQHHDAVTGTATELVTKDYAKQLARAQSEAEEVIDDYFQAINETKAGKKNSKKDFFFCPLLNETNCNSLSDANYYVTIFNANGRTLNTTVMLPLYKKPGFVTGSMLKGVVTEIVHTFQVAGLPEKERAPYQLYVPLSIPPLGYATFFVENSGNRFRNRSFARTRFPKLRNPFSIENEYLQLIFDTSGYLKTVFDKATNKSHPLRQEFFYYEGVGKSNEPSGAYVFRPAAEFPIAFSPTLKFEVVTGALVNEVRQVVSEWVAQTIRLPHGKPYIEFEWIVGPIPKEAENQTTKEIVTRYNTRINSLADFYTDANGRQSMKRTFNTTKSAMYEGTEPVSANYYPITSHVFIKDNEDQFSILTDRAHGATAVNGSVEIMLHRRCFYDDHWGVEEALDEPGRDGKGLVVLGKHTVFFSNVKEAAAKMRPLAVEKFYEPVIGFSKTRRGKEVFAGLTRDLPEFVHFLTMESWHKKSILLRFENVLQTLDQTNSAPRVIDLTGLFTNFEITAMRELKLGGNRNATRRVDNGDLLITLNPMEIRTFEADIQMRP